MAIRMTLEQVTSVVFAVSALSVAGVVVANEFWEPERGSPRPQESPEYLIGWEDEVERGIRLGPTDAPVTIMEFVDFECPFCRRFAGRMDTLRSEYPDDIQLVLHHFPLDMHRFAQVSAVAVECAADQGRWKQFHELIFQKQDSIGLKDWRSLAVEADVPNVEKFERCRRDNPSRPRIDYGRALAERAGITATPTVIINGWKMPSPPNLEQLRDAVESILDGRFPASGDSSRIAPASMP